MGRQSREAAWGARIRLIALLAWYDESPTWLAHTVASLSKANVDHLVACDGAYSLYPGANSRPVSSVEQSEAILETCRGLGIGCSLHVPQGPWRNNEIEKRSFLFRAGNLVAEPWEDWFLLIDADETVRSAPIDLHDRLWATTHNVAGVTLSTIHDPHETESKSLAVRNISWGETNETGQRVFVRAIPSLRCEQVHARYVCENQAGETVWLRGSTEVGTLAEYEPIPDFVIEHRHEFRDKARRDAAQQYYRMRDRFGAELVTA